MTSRDCLSTVYLETYPLWDAPVPKRQPDTWESAWNAPPKPVDSVFTGSWRLSATVLFPGGRSTHRIPAEVSSEGALAFSRIMRSTIRKPSGVFYTATGVDADSVFSFSFNKGRGIIIVVSFFTPPNFKQSFSSAINWKFPTFSLHQEPWSKFFGVDLPLLLVSFWI